MRIVLGIEKKKMQFEAEGRDFANFLEISRTIYSNSERSVQFLKQNTFLLVQWTFDLRKILGAFCYKKCSDLL